MPVRFGTWFWGLGMTREHLRAEEGRRELRPAGRIARFKPIQQHMNLLTNFTAFRDGAPGLPLHRLGDPAHGQRAAARRRQAGRNASTSRSPTRSAAPRASRS
jgi:hypothetical protein